MTTEELQDTCATATSSTLCMLRREVYASFNRNMSTLENRGIYIGNAHHAAQRMQGEVMEILNSLVEELYTREIVKGAQ